MVGSPKRGGSYPYTGTNGTAAHQRFFQWVKAQDPSLVTDSALSTIFNPQLGRSRPDVVDKADRTLFELKPITHKNNAAASAKDQGQLQGYMSQINSGAKPGEEYSLGNPTDLVPEMKGGFGIGSIEGAGGKVYDVRLYPGERGSGMIYYSLTESPADGGKTVIEQLGDAIRKNAPVLFPPGGRRGPDPSLD